MEFLDIKRHDVWTVDGMGDFTFRDSASPQVVFKGLGLIKKEFTCEKWTIGYNFGIDDGAESKFGAHKELIVLKILKYKHCVNKSRDMSRDHFAKNRKLFTNW